MKKIYGLFVSALLLIIFFSFTENQAAPRQAAPVPRHRINMAPPPVNINQCQSVAESDAEKMSPTVTLKIYGNDSGDRAHLFSSYSLNPVHWEYDLQRMPGIDMNNRQAVNEAIRTNHNAAHASIAIKTCDMNAHLDRIVVEANILPSAYNNCDCPQELLMHILASLDPQYALTWPTPLRRVGRGQCNYQGEINHQNLQDLFGSMQTNEQPGLARMFIVVGIGSDITVHPRTQVKFSIGPFTQTELREDPEACLQATIAAHELKPYY